MNFSVFRIKWILRWIFHWWHRNGLIFSEYRTDLFSFESLPRRDWLRHNQIEFVFLLFFLIIDDDGVKNYHLLITRRQDNTRIIYNFVISTNHKTFVVLIQFFPFHVSSIRIIACICIFKWFQSFVCLSKERSSRKCFCSSAFVLAAITEKRNNAKNWQRNCWFFSFFGGDD